MPAFLPALIASLAAALFALFPLTDADIWWHLALAREWLIQGPLAADPLTWTPSRLPWVDIHEYFERIVYFVFKAGGAPLLVVFKAIIWGCAFYLFARMGDGRKIGKGCGNKAIALTALSVFVLFTFRYTFELRPVLLSLVFLGAYWNIFPALSAPATTFRKKSALCIALLMIQWLWCRTQGLFILGPIFASIHFVSHFREMSWRSRTAGGAFLIALFATPLAHFQGKEILLYPFPLSNRLLGATADASVFASGIAENRSPVTLLFAKESPATNGFLVFLSAVAIFAALKCVFNARINADAHARAAWLGICAVLTLIAERNAALLLPPFIAMLLNFRNAPGEMQRKATPTSEVPLTGTPLRKVTPDVLGKTALFTSLALAAFAVCFWIRSLTAYSSAVSEERVPVRAAEWCAGHPHPGRLFNDDRAGGYLSWKNPKEKTFIDGRFILRSPEFFERYLNYAQIPGLFITDADSLNIDRVVLPLRYYAKWGRLIPELLKTNRWHIVYNDDLYVVMDKF